MLKSSAKGAKAPQAIKLVLIEDHAVVSAGLRVLLESEPGLSVVGVADNREDGLALAAKVKPDLVLLDIMLGDDNSLDFLPELLANNPKTRVIVLTGSQDPQIHRQAIALGAMGLVLKEHASDILLKAIERVSAGEAWFDPSMMANVLTEMARASQGEKADPEAAKIAALTERERQVIHLIGEGLKNKQIADRLFITETTVRHHLTSIFDKLDVSDRLELVIYAYRHNLVQRPT